MLTDKQLEQNKKKFKEINEKYNIFTPELESFLGEDFYTAPSTISLDNHGCYMGGLLNICFKAAKHAVNLNEQLPESIRQDKKSIIRVVFLSQIGKTFMFKLNDNQWEIEKLGRIFKFAEKDVTMKNSEKSLFYMLKYNVDLNENEFQSISNNESKGILSSIIKMGFELAILEEKYGQK